MSQLPILSVSALQGGNSALQQQWLWCEQSVLIRCKSAWAKMCFLWAASVCICTSPTFVHSATDVTPGTMAISRTTLLLMHAARRHLHSAVHDARDTAIGKCKHVMPTANMLITRSRNFSKSQSCCHTCSSDTGTHTTSALYFSVKFSQCVETTNQAF